MALLFIPLVNGVAATKLDENNFAFTVDSQSPDKLKAQVVSGPYSDEFKNTFKEAELIKISLLNTSKTDQNLKNFEIEITPATKIPSGTVFLSGGTDMGRTPLQRVISGGDDFRSSGTYLIGRRSNNDYFLPPPIYRQHQTLAPLPRERFSPLAGSRYMLSHGVNVRY